MKKIGISMLLVPLVAIIWVNSKDQKDNSEKIVIGGQTWAGSIIIEHIMKQVVEDNFPVKVENKQMNQSLIWQAMEDGSVDVFPDLWMPNQEAKFNKYIRKRKTVAAGISYDKAPQGFYLPRKYAEKFKIFHINDLKGKEHLFDSNHDNRGEIWIGPYSWSSAGVNTARIKQYGLNIDTLTVEQAIFLATLKKAMQLDKPIIFYYWEPEWPMIQYDLVKLKEDPCPKNYWFYDPDDSSKNRVDCEYPSAVVYVGVSKKLKTRLPKVYNFFMHFNIPISEVSRLIMEMEDLPGNPEKDPKLLAKKWVLEHPKIVASWFHSSLPKNAENY